MRNSGAPALRVREFVLCYSRLRGKSERKHYLTGLGERCNRRLSLYRLITGHFIAIMSKKSTHRGLYKSKTVIKSFSCCSTSGK